MANGKAAAIVVCSFLIATALVALVAWERWTWAQDVPSETATQSADESSPGAPSPDEAPADEPPPEDAPPPQPAPVDTTAVITLLEKTDKGELTADEHVQLVKGLDGLVSSNLDTTEMLRLAQWSHKSLTGDEKAALRVKILDRLIGSTGVPPVSNQQPTGETPVLPASKLSVDDARQATVVFDVLNGPDEKGKLAVAWMVASQTWKTAGPEPLVRFLTALNLAKPDDAAASRTALVDHVWTTYLSPQADAAKTAGPAYAELAIQTHRFLSPENAQVLSKFLVARLSEPQTAAQLTMADIKKVRQTLGSLHNPLDAADVIAAWIAASSVAQPPSAVAASAPAGDNIAANGAAMPPPLSPADIGFLCDQLRPKEGMAGPKGAIAALVENARSRKLLTDAESILATSPGEWPAMARALRNYVSDGERQAMIATVTALFIKDTKQTAKLTPAQLTDLAEMAAYYGRADQAGQVALIWFAANDLSKLPPEQISLVGTALSFGSPPAVGAKKASLGELVWTAYLSKEEFLAKTPLPELADFVKNVSSALTPEQKGRTASALLARFAADAAGLAKLSVSDTIRLAQAVALMEKPQDAADLIVRWMGAIESWTQAGLYDQQVLAGILKAGNTEDSGPKAVELALAVYKQHLAELKGGQVPETSALAKLASFMQAMGLTGKDKGFPEFAAALVSALEAGASAGDGPQCRALSLPLGTPETREVLAGKLVAAGGSINRQVAKVLAWRDRQYDSLDNLRRLIDARLAETSLTGDSKALWLLARADLAAVEKFPERLAGRAWLERVPEAATARTVKLAGLEELCLELAEGGKEIESLTILEQVKAQLDPEQDAARLAVLKGKLRERFLLTVRLQNRLVQAIEAAARKHADLGNAAMSEKFLKTAATCREAAQAAQGRVATLGPVE